MKKKTINLPEIRLIGLKVRTNNKDEMDSSTAKIGTKVQQFFNQNLFEKIPHRKEPSITYCAYTDYENDHTGNYTFIIGKAVTHFDHIPESFSTHIIPSQTYIQFTTELGPMPTVVIEAWQKIWHMTPTDLGGERRYLADFEFYEEGALHSGNIPAQIYIGIKD